MQMFLLKTSKAISDEELAKGCSQGLEKFCKILFEQFYGKMLNVCKRYARDRDEAKDILQEGFIRVFKNISQYQHKGSLEGWIRRVMVTTAINYNKKYRMNNLMDHLENDSLPEFDDASAAPVFTINPAVEKMDSEKLLAMIQSLPSVYKMVFNMHAIEGYSHREIAETLSITESTSRSNLTKARQKLQQIINKETLSKKNYYEGN